MSKHPVYYNMGYSLYMAAHHSGKVTKRYTRIIEPLQQSVTSEGTGTAQREQTGRQEGVKSLVKLLQSRVTSCNNQKYRVANICYNARNRKEQTETNSTKRLKAVYTDEQRPRMATTTATKNGT